MILILDAWESGNDQNEWLVNQAFVVFTEMQTNGVHKLAELAVKRISDGLAQLGHRRQERANAAAAASAAMSRRQSQQNHPAYPPVQHQPALTLDTSSLLDLSGDTVMGNTSGMFLLEDSGLQTYIPQTFAPFNFALPTAAATYPYPSAHPDPRLDAKVRNPSDPPTPARYSPAMPTTVPVSNVTVAPFPVMSPTFNFNSQAIVSTTNAGPYAVGLQPRITSQRRVSHPTAGFVPVNAGEQQAYAMQQAQQQGYAGYGGGGAAHGHGHGHRHGHRADRGPRSQSRRQR